MWQVYNLIIHIGVSLLKVAAIFNRKLDHFLRSRRSAPPLSNGPINKPTLLVHCASLGEYEMAVPVLADPRIRDQFYTVVSFFSPSGYEYARIDSIADAKCYLPFDSTRKLTSFLNELQPAAVVFVRYDLWFNLIRICAKRDIPVLMINALFQRGRWPFTGLGRIFLKTLKSIHHFTVQNDESAHTLYRNGIPNNHVTVAPDLRFDRVWERCQSVETGGDLLRRLITGKPTIIAGSSWPDEEGFLAGIWASLGSSANLVLVPHDVSEPHIHQLMEQFKAFDPQRWTANHDTVSSVLIVDQIGLLARLYAQADVAVVGGAFGKGLHNILEAATFGLPILTGPNIQRFPEAMGLKKVGALHVFSNEDELQKELISLIEDATLRQSSGNKARNYVQERTGSKAQTVQIILDTLSITPDSSNQSKS
ncbi:MAG: hypothetical protein KDC76_09790 [Bacteroidetes bacterium]|nr:hypothetical protein [Bacteroidota bacterium]